MAAEECRVLVFFIIWVQGKMTPHVKRENSITVLSTAILNIHIFTYFVYLQFCCVIFAANKTLRGEINVLVKGDFQMSL